MTNEHFDHLAMKRPIKISILSMNLSTNCTNRCLRIAQALDNSYEVEIVGATFGVGTNWGVGIWPPLENTVIPIRPVRGDYLPGFIRSIIQLLKMLDGDVIIACKPRFPSLGIALIKKFISGTPVILDVDDDELAQTLPGKKASFLKQLINTSGYLFTRITHPFWKWADAVFTVSEHFRHTYGGTIVPHGQDPLLLDPARYDRNIIRSEIGIADDEFIITFIGTPQHQKGIDLILEAIKKLNAPKLKLMIIGFDKNDSYQTVLKQHYEKIIILIPPQPIEKIPYSLAAADCVALPQRNVPESLGQMPAKLTDAMAMAKPVIASALSDIPLHLKNRGLLIEPGDVNGLANHIAWLITHKEEAKKLGQDARKFFLENLTLEAMLLAMQPQIERVLKRT
ncbi:MAG: glycosyltransferase [Burkholderiales bacterium]